MLKQVRLVACSFVAPILLVHGCKSGQQVSSVKETDSIAAAYRGVFHFTDSMLIPYPNIGYDKAFCAGTSLMHATVFNRARFYEANPPSLKCPQKFTTADDKVYENAVWAAIQEQALKRDFVSPETLHIYGSKNFRELGTKSLHKFREIIRPLQDRAGDKKNLLSFWDFSKASIGTYDEMAGQVRRGNYLILAVHATKDDPDTQHTKTFEALRQDCEARGYVWDPVARECDWTAQMPEKHPYKEQSAGPGSDDDTPIDPQNPGNPDSSLNADDPKLSQIQNQYPAGEGGAGTGPAGPDTRTTGTEGFNNSQVGAGEAGPYAQNPDTNIAKFGPNHVVLVVGAYDDNSLLVYTTWSDSFERWNKDMKIESEGMWMVAPIILEVIPNRAGEDRSKAPDLLARVNEKYGYTGPGAARGCPGTGGSSQVAREENNAYDSLQNGPYNPYDETPDAPILDKPSDTPFWFNAEPRVKNGRRWLHIQDIQGCTTGRINWVVSLTSFDAKTEQSAGGVARWQSKANIIATSYPVSWEYDRYQVTGTCTDKTPFSVIVHERRSDSGVR